MRRTCGPATCLLLNGALCSVLPGGTTRAIGALGRGDHCKPTTIHPHRSAPRWGGGLELSGIG